MKSLFFVLFLSLLSIKTSYAACVPFYVGEEAVAGKTYVLENSPNPKHPIKITFSHSNDEVSYGSALIGHPGGTYTYRGNCYGGVTIYFTSNFVPNKTEVFMILHHQDIHHFKLKDAKNISDVYIVEIE